MNWEGIWKGFFVKFPSGPVSDQENREREREREGEKKRINLGCVEATGGPAHVSQTARFANGTFPKRKPIFKMSALGLIRNGAIFSHRIWTEDLFFLDRCFGSRDTERLKRFFPVSLLDLKVGWISPFRQRLFSWKPDRFVVMSDTARISNVSAWFVESRELSTKKFFKWKHFLGEWKQRRTFAWGKCCHMLLITGLAAF